MALQYPLSTRGESVCIYTIVHIKTHTIMAPISLYHGILLGVLRIYLPTEAGAGFTGGGDCGFSPAVFYKLGI